ncbi:hypothetical protein BaRGS_00014853 [Batillaria attramentaria]|uniref:Uncharacterized protein n=1 Tax=Batillaria attramentaria TaxID=370345 RepID=A0ABD0L3Z4_9CAEN
MSLFSMANFYAPPCPGASGALGKVPDKRPVTHNAVNSFTSLGPVSPEIEGNKRRTGTPWQALGPISERLRRVRVSRGGRLSRSREPSGNGPSNHMNMKISR